jgi:tRNA 2-thiouridine synthesizing protein A
MTARRDPMGEIDADRELNCRGMRCPLPVIYTRKALARMHAGEVLMIIATDPGSKADMVEFSRRGHVELVAHRELSGDYIYWLRKA